MYLKDKIHPKIIIQSSFAHPNVGRVKFCGQ